MQSVKNFIPADAIRAESHRKGAHFHREIAAIDLDAGRPVVGLRIYSTQARAYACVWISHRESQTYASGSGMAGGCGYHRASAAAATAFAAAGVELSDSIAGVGNDAMRGAVEAVARHLGVVRVYLHEANA